MNNYARVVSINADGRTVIYADKTTDGIAQIGTGALIMFHVSKYTDSTDMNLLGKFILAKVLSDDGSALSLDTLVTQVFDTIKISKYNCQIISIAQFNNLTINYNYNMTKAWDNTKKIGGICAIACRGLLNLEGGYINVEGKGGGMSYGKEGLSFIGNAQMMDILPLGQGHGSVFLLTKEIQENQNSRIGATYDGAVFGGNGESQVNGGGYKGKNMEGYGGGGDGGGTGGDGNNHGGYGENGKHSSDVSASQGAHLFIVTEKMNDFLLSIISTGGKRSTMRAATTVGDGGAGYGAGGNDRGTGAAGGGYNGGGGGGGRGDGFAGGGSSGWAFIYTNRLDNFNTNGVIV